MDHPYFSIEFFPPKTPEGVENLRAARTELSRLGAKYFSVTLGAGGSARYGNNDTVTEIQSAGLEAAPHLLCIGSLCEHVRTRLQEYKDHGIRHLVALRGDLPEGERTKGEFQYANELVEFIRQQSWQASVPILMVTSEADAGRLAAVQEAGVSGICDKPFEPATVKKLLASMFWQA